MTTEHVKADQLNASFQGMQRLPLLRQVGLLLGLAASIALGVYVVLWLRAPIYSVLYHQVSLRDASKIANALQQQNIPFEVADNGLILVDAKKVREARIALAAQDLSHAGGYGFDVMERGQGLAATDFIQNAGHQRVLEGELARTIMSISAVESAWVHLILPNESDFLVGKRKPSASVFINLMPGRHLGNEQISAIIHLVASSVPDMDSNAVTLVDDKGHLLSNPDTTSGIGFYTRQLEYKRNVEAYLASKIENILSPIVGSNKVRAQVVATLDFTRLEMPKKASDRNTSIVRSEQRVNTGNKLDRPNVTRDVSSSSIKRLSIAVVVDHKMVRNDRGEWVSTAYSPDELNRFMTLAKEAVDFDTMRGDKLHVMNSEFSLSPPTPLLEQPWLWDAGKQALGGLLLVLLLIGILRPVMRDLARIPADKAAATTAGNDSLDEKQVTLTGDKGQRLAKPNEYKTDLEIVKALVIQEPKRVAQVVKQWVNEG